MEFGLMTEPQLGMTYEELLDAAKFAEDAGLVSFARSDHYLFPSSATPPHATDALATLAGLARETSRIDLCVLVAPITFRHPAVLAKTAATIDEMSGGRFALGVGTGWMEEEHEAFGLDFYDLNERFERMEDALAYLWHAFGRTDGPFEGRHYSLTNEDVRPKPTGSIPLIVGGSGERRTPRLAGTYADEFNFGFRPVDDIGIRIDRAREAAAKAGRDPDALRISMMTSVAGGTDHDGLQRMLGWMADADPRGRSAAELEKAYRDRGAPIGTTAELRDLFATYEEAGVDRIHVQHFGPFDRDVLEELFAAVGATPGS